ncbi:MAG TPA: lipoyl(octanoyl) transferase LipB [Solirubrobacteraceae bacterium]|jgi:lipoyl(octanoyl) transferase|nr:lipoyl(octanoyl) transferase LipB [Solirubrobacteraceae bacterium]
MTVTNRSSQELWVCHLGTVPYRDALAIQEDVRARRVADELPDTLLLLEHPPVYTRGRRSGAEDLPLGEDFYRAKGIDVVATDRGGKLTYHGPGQLVGYPIMRIDDVNLYLRTMEHSLIVALGDAGVQARSRRDEGIDYTGVWVRERKIASIGVHVSRGVTTHGFAVNVDNDLEPFSWVLACGLPDVTMTSLARELATGDAQGALPGDASTLACEPALACMRKRVAHAFTQAHGRRQRLVSPARLGIDTANAARRATERAPIKTTPSRHGEPVPA